MSAPLLGLRTVIYPAPDLDATKAWWTSFLGVEPYFDQPFYVGFAVGGYELGLLPDADPDEGIVTAVVTAPDGTIIGFIDNPNLVAG